MAYGFAKQSGGHLVLDSELNKGTLVRLLLPKTARASLQREAAVSPELARGHESILVVEDEPDLRAYAVGQLRNLGYNVQEAPNASTALELLKTDDTRFDLLFSDIVLPSGMTGVELAQEARRIKPDIGVVLTTGYFDHTQVASDLPILRKPYRRDELAAAIRRHLESRSSAIG